jgi:septation ring formation regulator EzrA
MKQNKITIDKLAGMVKRGFGDVEDRLGKRLGGVESDIKDIKIDLSNVKLDVSEIKADLHRVDETTDKIYNLLDKNLKNQEEFKQEFKIVKHQQGKMQEVLKEKLGAETN